MCRPINLHVRDVTYGNQILPRAMVIQRKTQRPVQFELTEPTRAAVAACFDTPICANGASLDRGGQAKFIGLRDAIDAAHQSDVDLQTDEESESCSAIVWLYKRVPSQAVDENGQSWSVCVNVGNLRDTGHSAEPTPPAAMADDLTAMPRQRPAANWPQAGILRLGYPAQLCGSI